MFDMENQPMTGDGYLVFYDLNGRRLRHESIASGVHPDIGWVEPVYTLNDRNIYFGGRMIQSNGKTVLVDRLGSVRADETGAKFEYFPYGEEMALTPQGREKFATYTRSSATGLDYAINRWYDSVHGNFITADPHIASMDLSNPATMNRYAYVGGDPINTTDAEGLDGGDGCGAGTWATDFGTCAPGPFGPDTDPGDNPANWGTLACSNGMIISASASVTDLVGCYGSGSMTPVQGPGPVPYQAPPPQCPLVAPTGDYRVLSGAVALFAPDMAAKLDAAITILNQEGIVPQITSGFRSADKQLALQGSPFGAAQVSWHQVGEAVDINHNVGRLIFGQIINAMTDADLWWGGNFRRRDPVHFVNAPPGTRPDPAQVAECAREHP